MERIGGEGEGQRTSLWQVIGASVIGTVMEWYDFFIYDRSGRNRRARLKGGASFEVGAARSNLLTTE